MPASPDKHRVLLYSDDTYMIRTTSGGGEVGRPERSLDPEQGTVQAFAAALRELRVAAGSPTYRELAKRAHYSHTVISDAARGERLPTLAVTLAFVRACGGDSDEWQARWYAHRQRAVLAGLPVGDGDAGNTVVPAPSVISTTYAGPPPRTSSGRFRAVAYVAAVLLLGIVAGWQMRAATEPGARSPVLPFEDGADPKDLGCTDNTSLVSEDVVLNKDATIEQMSLKAGTVVGKVTLRFSVRCGAAWSRFDPTLDGLKPNDGAVEARAERPTDGSAASFRPGRIEESYSGMLLTGLGCVVAKATFTVTGQSAVGVGETPCLPHQ